MCLMNIFLSESKMLFLDLHIRLKFDTNLNYSEIFNTTMNILLLVSTIFCTLLLLFIAFAFINNSDFRLSNESPNSGAPLENDTSPENETANETENQ
jgi:hypothetical protein